MRSAAFYRCALLQVYSKLQDEEAAAAAAATVSPTLKPLVCLSDIICGIYAIAVVTDAQHCSSVHVLVSLSSALLVRFRLLLMVVLHQFCSCSVARCPAAVKTVNAVLEQQQHCPGVCTRVTA